MHNLYYFIRWITATLAPTISGRVISECFTQERNELVLRMEAGRQSFWFRILFAADQSLIAFPVSFQRARKNSVDLFPGIIGQKIAGIETVLNDRAFVLTFESGACLEFQLYGRNGNVLWVSEAGEISAFKRHKSAGAPPPCRSVNRQVDWRPESYPGYQNRGSTYFIFSKTLWRYLDSKGLADLPENEQWRMIFELHEQLSHPEKVWLLHPPAISLLPQEEGQLFQDPLSASTAYFSAWHAYKALESQRAVALKTTREKIEQTQRYLEKTTRQRSELVSEVSYKDFGDLIMAHLADLQPGAEMAELPDFQHPERLIRIPLRAQLTPQKNAELYYRKARNQRIQLEKLGEAIQRRTEELRLLQESLSQLHESTWKPPREQGKTERSPESVPYFEEVMAGFRILVGRNAQSNDKLLQQFSFREDLWLHARDVPGSHVLIKYQAGKSFPAPVIARAASLAAYYSRRKTESLCPVIVTPRKYVRKRKGDPSGAVVVDREKVVMATPEALRDPAI